MVLEILPKPEEEVRGEVATPEEVKKEEEENMKIPSGTKCEGVIRNFTRSRGYGFIKIRESDKIGVFVHAFNFVTDDPCPFIEKGTKVEFEMVHRNGRPYAEKVTLEGGEKIPIYSKAHFKGVVNEKETFTGTVFVFRGGFGFITPDKEITWKGVCCEKKIHFYRYGLVMKQDETNKGTAFIPRIWQGVRVSFKVYMDERNNISACEIRYENGNPIDRMPRENFDINAARKSFTWKNKKKRVERAEKAREIMQKPSYGGYSRSDLKKMLEEEEKKLKERVLIEDGRTYNGIIKWYSTKKQGGTIHLNERIALKGYTLMYTIKFKKNDSVFLSSETIPQRGREVMFTIYNTGKELRACRIKNIDGTPIGVLIESSKSENKDSNKKRKRAEEDESLCQRKKIKREVVNEGKTYTGIVEHHSWKQKFWVINLKEKIEYKEHQAEKVIHAHKWDLDVKEKLRKKDEVTFKVYLGDKGLAAFQVKFKSKRKRKPSEKKVRDESSPTESNAKLENTEIQITDKARDESLPTEDNATLENTEVQIADEIK